MYIVLSSNGRRIFAGHLSDATRFILEQYGPLDDAIRAGVRIVPYPLMTTV